MVRKRFYISGIIIVALIIVVLVVKGVFFSSENKIDPEYYKTLTRFEASVYLLKDIYPTDIIWIGRKIELPEEYQDLYIRYEDDVSEKILRCRSNCKYVYIVINNADASLQLSEKQLRLIKDKTDLDPKYNLAYIGEKGLSLIACDEREGRPRAPEAKYSYFEVHGKSEIEVWYDWILPEDVESDYVLQQTIFSPLVDAWEAK